VPFNISCGQPTSCWRGRGFSLPWLCPWRLRDCRCCPFQLRKG
jgi:hypothetical protein